VQIVAAWRSKGENDVVNMIPMFSLLQPSTLLRLIPILNPVAFTVGEILLKDPDSAVAQEVRNTTCARHIPRPTELLSRHGPACCDTRMG
jgi:hypothetical protein